MRRVYETVAERMILHGAAARAYPLSSRQSRELNSIQRKFLLNNTGTYSTTPTAALQVIEGIISFHIKAKEETAYIRAARLRKISNNNNFNPKNYEDGTRSTTFRPTIFQLEYRISLNMQFPPAQGLDIYTGGSKIDDKAGSTFCVKEEDTTTYEWMAQLRPLNTESFKQRFLLYGRPVFGQARQAKRLSGNEAAEGLAKKATQEVTSTYIPVPRSHMKSLLQKEFIIRWQTEWDYGETSRSVYNVLPKGKITPSPWQRPKIMFVMGHGPFLTCLK
ncbi:hypothetical protein AVEN_34290-1 [Araneus ventricosus]|uniref:Uncharacterized protein n=1 Tax=Araneus ventricosus TaxID=182803 RepID=A0A4Y2JZS0_ARAVE|nr:hypothetical protein AVEN_34290-1 [Araneus ventricosus]